MFQENHLQEKNKINFLNGLNPETLLKLLLQRTTLRSSRELPNTIKIRENPKIRTLETSLDFEKHRDLQEENKTKFLPGFNSETPGHFYDELFFAFLENF